MKMKTYLLLPALFCAAVTVSPALRAQGTSPAPSVPATSPAGEEHHRGGNPLEMLAKKLDLTADQQAKLKPIFEDRHEKMKALRDDTSLTPDDKKAKAKALMESSNDQIKAILTPDQLTKYTALQAEMKEHREKQHEQAPAAPSATP
jgi:protein CpxP